MAAANVVPAADFQHVVAQLEDTQESLAAAFARIEVFRLREKLLAAELARLRIGGEAQQGDAADGPPGGDGAPAAAAQQAPEPPPPPAAPPSEPADAPDWPLPCYVTEVEGHLPVMLINSSTGRKTPGSVVITEDYVDFVEVRARVKRRDFVGFSSSSAAAQRRSQTSSSAAFSATWKQLLAPCLSPEPGSPSAAAHRGAEERGSPGRRRSYGGSGGGGGGSPLGGGSPRHHLAHSSSWHDLGHGSNGAPPPGHRRSGSGSSGGGGGGGTGVWQILWRSGGLQQHLAFEATQDTREALHRHTARWLHGSAAGAADDAPPPGVAQLLAAAAASSAAGGGALEMSVPRHLVPGPSAPPRLSEPSAILAPPGAGAAGAGAGLVDGLPHLAAALPPRFQGRAWALAYGSHRHGISLATLFRRGAGLSPSVLLVRDGGGHVFGAFATEPWRPAPRFFGSGETFVFQLAPHKVAFPWAVGGGAKNDFFQYATPDALAVGGLGAFAIWLDAELLQGSSGACGTFGSPCLASREEFTVNAVELWALV
ncbi:Oxr1 [Scenedesmus sp. PABB004]|nr:Oxr1 [Scenedesmus sp. PABB004]